MKRKSRKTEKTTEESSGNSRGQKETIKAGKQKHGKKCKAERWEKERKAEVEKYSKAGEESE